MTSRSSVNRRRRGLRSSRRAFTLMEIMLVLTLMVAIGAIVWAQLRAPFESVRLRSAGSQIQSAWARARVRAMRTGQTYMFQFQTNEGTYSCQAWTGPGDDQASMNSTTGFSSPNSASAATIQQRIFQGQLPENVQFLGAETSTDTRSAMVLSGGGNTDPGGNTPILFYPDGTTSNTHVVLTNRRQQCVVVSLRGITGQVRVSDIKAMNEVR